MARTDLRLLKSRLYNQPHLVTRQKLQDIQEVIESPDHQMMGYDEQRDHRETSMTRIIKAERGDIAHISVHGTMVQRSGWLGAMSGLVSYDMVRREVDNAIQEPTIHALLLDIDSPGGEGAGCFDFVDWLYEARGSKPIVAFSNEAAYSAAYAIASAADELYVPRTGGVGSIGVIATHVDLTEFDKKQGYKYTEIFAGDRKADLSPHRKLSTQAAEWLQGRVDEMYDLFVMTAARNRGMSEKAIRDTQAACYVGKAAVVHNLADGIMNFDQVVQHTNMKLRNRNMTVSIVNTQTASASDSSPAAVAPDVGESDLHEQLRAALAAQGPGVVVEAETETPPDEPEASPEGDAPEDEQPTAESEEGDAEPDAADDDADEGAEDEPEADADEVQDEPDIDEAADEGAEAEPPPAAASAEQPDAQFSRMDAARIIRACDKAGVPSAAAKFIDDGMTLEEVQERLSGAETIRALCTAARVPDRAEQYIKAGLSANETRARLFDVIAETGGDVIHNQLKPSTNESRSINASEIWNRRAKAEQRNTTTV